MVDPGIAKIWADNGGLIGLIVLALFGLILYLIRQHRENINRIVEDSSAHMRQVLEQHRAERDEWRRSDEAVRRETNELIKDLAGRL